MRFILLIVVFFFGVVLGIFIFMGTSIREEFSDVKYAKILFSEEVTRDSVPKLISTIEEINRDHEGLEKIYLYIISWGGDADGGEAAYQIIKSSRIPITTVNLANVGSAATFMFCGGKERLSFEDGTFLLHPPANVAPKRTWTPDELRQMEEVLRTYVNFGVEVYKSCTTIPEAEIKALLYSEDQRLVLSAKQAKEKGLISGTVSEIIDTPYSYLVSDE